MLSRQRSTYSIEMHETHLYFHKHYLRHEYAVSTLTEALIEHKFRKQ